MSVLANNQQVAEMVSRLATEIGGAMADGGPWAIVGIRSRGDVLAKRLAERLKPDHVGSVDITLYRDDLSEIGPQPIVQTTDIPFDLDGTRIVLIDDVLMTGRSVRAAIQTLIDYGRPKVIKLAVLVDRGGRELPIRPDFVAQRLNLDDQQHVRVQLKPADKDDRIELVPRQ
jgi:pyrimidine operon attenuation protein/uracil phosphoribosyltransferase